MEENRSYAPPLRKHFLEASKIYIPAFDPKTSNRSLIEWLKIVQNARIVWKWSEIQTIQHAGSVLEGDAAKWYVDWLTSTPTWDDFEQSLTRRCCVMSFRVLRNERFQRITTMLWLDEIENVNIVKPIVDIIQRNVRD